MSMTTVRGSRIATDVPDAAVGTQVDQTDRLPVQPEVESFPRHRIGMVSEGDRGRATAAGHDLHGAGERHRF